MDTESIVKLILQGGVAPLLLIILWAGLKRYWVFGWYAKELEQDRDEWKEAALKGTRLAHRTLDIAEAKKDDL